MASSPKRPSIEADTITSPPSSTHNTIHFEDQLENAVSDKKQEIETIKVAVQGEGLIDNPKGWMVVFSTFLVNFFCFGVVFQWGNYQQLYLEIYAKDTDTFRISFVGTIGSSALLCSGVFLTPVIQKLGYRRCMAIGSVLCPLGLVLSSLATSLWTIYLAQGLLFGIGAGLCFAPSIALPSQWFNKNRSLATGLAVSGSGIGAVAISPMTERLFSTLGYRNTLRVEGAMGFGILMLATAMAFSRYRPAGTFSIIDTKLLTKDMLITILFCVIMPFGYLGPFFLAPQYASFLHRTPAEGAALISIMSGMNSISRIAMGFIADRLGRINTMFMCTFLAGIFTMVVWEFSTSYGPYIAYCVLYGLTGGAFVSLLPVLIADIVGVENIQRGIGMSYTMTVFGSLFGTPLIGLLLQRYGWTDAIQFCGATTVFSSLVVLYLRYLRSNGKIFLII